MSKQTMIKALEEFNKAHFNLQKEWDKEDVINELSAANYYPFHKSFDEIDVDAWVKGCIKELNQSLKGRKFDIASVVYENTGGNCMVLEVNVVYEDHEHVYIGVNEECAVVYEHQHLCCSEEDYEKYSDEDAIESYHFDDDEPMDSRFYAALLQAIRFWLFHSNARVDDPDLSPWHRWMTAEY